ncbi:uncharacterized protein LOC135944236 [Cloeon dipterum]|uniref:uncharacterized protein LOC135944236 n=1 Tax=Cloeon dipterum TaxID=197152 RepID=UPI00321F6DEA
MVDGFGGYRWITEFEVERDCWLLCGCGCELRLPTPTCNSVSLHSALVCLLSQQHIMAQAVEMMCLGCPCTEPACCTSDQSSSEAFPLAATAYRKLDHVLRALSNPASQQARSPRFLKINAWRLLPT